MKPNKKTCADAMSKMNCGCNVKDNLRCEQILIVCQQQLIGMLGTQKYGQAVKACKQCLKDKPEYSND